jgi:hypothetical protein
MVRYVLGTGVSSCPGKPPHLKVELNIDLINAKYFLLPRGTLQF